jgi:hypothetical protein
VGADPTPAPTRSPTLDDLKRVGAALNAAHAKYLVIGRFAVNYCGFTRATEDLDLLIAQESENIERVKRALCVLPDQAAKDLTPTDFAHYSVIRIVDEITVALLTKAGDVRYENAETVPVRLDEVSLPFASLRTLIATKPGARERDQLDRAYLLRLQAEQAQTNDRP